MSDVKQFVVYPLRYYPDLATGEFVNVGVGLVAAETMWWGVRVANEFRGFKRVFPAAQMNALRSTLVRVGRLAAHRSSRRIPLIVSGLRWKHPREPLEGLVSGNRGSLRWGDALMEGVGVDLEAELDSWFRRFVSVRKDVELPPASDGHAALAGALRQELERRDLLRYLFPRDVGSRKRHFPFTYRNGKLNVFEAVDLAGRSADLILRQGERWRGKLEVLGDEEPNMAFYALVRMPESSRLRDDAELALTMMKRTNSLQLEAFTLDRVDELGKLAADIVKAGHSDDPLMRSEY